MLNIKVVLHIQFLQQSKTIFCYYGTITGPLLGQYGLFSNSSKLLTPKMLLSSWKRISKEMRLLWCVRTTGRLDKKLHAMTKALGGQGDFYSVYLGSRSQERSQKNLPLFQSLIVIGKKFVLQSFLLPHGNFYDQTAYFQTQARFWSKQCPYWVWKESAKKCDFYGVYKQLGPAKKLHVITLTLESRSWKGHESISPALNFDCDKYKVLRYEVFCREQKQNSVAVVAETD